MLIVQSSEQYSNIIKELEHCKELLRIWLHHAHIDVESPLRRDVVRDTMSVVGVQ